MRAMMQASETCEGRSVSDQSPPAGWYPDPQVPGLLRWWDGRWTEHVQQPPTPSPVPDTRTLPPPTIPTPPSPSAWAAPPAPTIPPTASQPATKQHHGIFRGEKESGGRGRTTPCLSAEMGIPEREQLRTELLELRATSQGSELRSHPPCQGDTPWSRGGQPQGRRGSTGGDPGNCRRAGEKQKALEQYKEVADPPLPTSNAYRTSTRTSSGQWSRPVRRYQEVGIYEYRHPLDNAPAYKARLTGIQAKIKDAVKGRERRQGLDELDCQRVLGTVRGWSASSQSSCSVLTTTRPRASYE